jgi:DnaJ family protein C protein 19
LLLFTFIQFLQATPLIAGLAVAATALAGRYGIQAWQAYKARPIVPRMRKFYEGGFQPTMNRREAALILGVRCKLHKAFLSYLNHSQLFLHMSIQLFSAF